VHLPTQAIAHDVRWPPLRFWLSSLFLAGELRFLEKASSISSGGASGVSLALYHWTHLPLGLWTFVVKILILVLVWRVQGRRQLLWTVVSATLGSVMIFLAELVPFQPLPLPIAFPMILLFSYMPSALLLSCGYSSGGFSSIALILEQKGLPTAVTFTALNAISLLLMFLAYGRVSGLLSLVAMLFAGASNWIWLSLFRRYLRHLPHSAASAA
jgi:uncharacterized membrane-anchored protein YitT (DUF2179 family)